MYPDGVYTCTVHSRGTQFCFKVNLCVEHLGFASGRNLYICVPAAHPPGGSRGEDSVGEGGGGAGGGAARPALQRTLPGERRQVRAYPEDHVGVEKAQHGHTCVSCWETRRL